MAKVIINCIGCGENFHKNLCKKVYRGQMNYGFICPHCEEEAKHKKASRKATNKSTEKATSGFYTLKMNVTKPNESIIAWLESLGYATKYDNFGRVDFIGNEVNGFQSITKVLNSYDKRFTEPYTISVHCRDLRGNEIDLNSLDLVRVFSKYKGYEKVIAILEA